MSGELASFEVDGYQLVYQDLGEGTPVLLVHGSLCDYRYWQWQLRSLGERHRLIVPSLRHYYPERWDGQGADFTSARHVADLLALVERLGEPVHLLGHSRGGNLALRLALAAPDALRSLSLADPGGDYAAEVYAHAGLPAPRGAIGTQPVPAPGARIDPWRRGGTGTGTVRRYGERRRGMETLVGDVPPNDPGQRHDPGRAGGRPAAGAVAVGTALDRPAEPDPQRRTQSATVPGHRRGAGGGPAARQAATHPGCVPWPQCHPSGGFQPVGTGVPGARRWRCAGRGNVLKRGRAN
ncbi:alpha/beta fold hydrolase [Pseudomonas aeruginosa]|uniref:alpha/beta fold hydrolase n=1 Tax=Pseudomonas aeruginosa TaxID=287 RepID=UPI003A1039B7